MFDISWIAIEELTPNGRNARTHSRKQIRQIADSIAAFGFVVPILIARRVRPTHAPHRSVAARPHDWLTPQNCFVGGEFPERYSSVPQTTRNPFNISG